MFCLSSKAIFLRPCLKIGILEPGREEASKPPYPGLNRGSGSGIGLLRTSLRTGLAVLLHPALRSVSCSFTETKKLICSGIKQAEEPELIEVTVGPVVMILHSTPVLAAIPFSQDGPQANPQPSIHLRHLVLVRVLEVGQPPFQHAVLIGHDGFHASPTVPLGFRFKDSWQLFCFSASPTY